MTHRAQQVPLDTYFDGSDPASRPLFEQVAGIVATQPDTHLRVTRSQIAWSRRRAFAWAWMPQQYLGQDRGLAPLVVSVDLDHRDGSNRWKQVVEVREGHFMHHLEVWSADDVDDELASWIHDAWVLAR